MDIHSLVRANIRRLTPYVSARSEHAEGILLDANENTWGSVLEDGPVPLNRYPDPSQGALRRQLATLERVDVSNVFTGVGSDEVIDLLLRVFCDPGRDRVLIAEPTYGMYRVASDVHDVTVDTVSLDTTFHLDVPAARMAVGPRTKLVFLCSPNNPTGNLVGRAEILSLCRATSAVVVVDEAYIDFSLAPSLAADVKDTPNLVILKTLSKSWGLAGIRLGYCLAHPEIVSYMDKIKAPYNISSLTGAAALRALAARKDRDELVRRIIGERERLRPALSALPYVHEVYPSEANFLLARVADHRRLLAFLSSRRIIIRDRSSQPGLSGCVRITVGRPDENNALLDAMREFGNA